MSKKVELKDETANGTKPVLGDVLVLEVPNGSYNFSITQWDDFNQEHRLRYDAAQHYAGTFGQSFGGTMRHSEALVIEQKGNWVIEKIEDSKAFLKNIA